MIRVAIASRLVARVDEAVEDVARLARLGDDPAEVEADLSTPEAGVEVRPERLLRRHAKSGLGELGREDVAPTPRPVFQDDVEAVGIASLGEQPARPCDVPRRRLQVGRVAEDPGNDELADGLSQAMVRLGDVGGPVDREVDRLPDPPVAERRIDRREVQVLHDGARSDGRPAAGGTAKDVHGVLRESCRDLHLPGEELLEALPRLPLDDERQGPPFGRTAPVRLDGNQLDRSSPLVPQEAVRAGADRLGDRLRRVAGNDLDRARA